MCAATRGGWELLSSRLVNIRPVIPRDSSGLWVRTAARGFTLRAVMGPKDDVEPRRPGLAAVGRAIRGFTHAAGVGIPDTAHQPLGAAGKRLGRGQHHPLAVEVSVEQQKLAVIRDPALVPEAPAGVVRAEALAFVAAGLLIV